MGHMGTLDSVFMILATLVGAKRCLELCFTFPDG